MHRAIFREDMAAISRHNRVDPIVIDVAVETLAPGASPGKADPVAILIHLAQAGDHNDVLADAFDPAMEGNDAVAIVDMEDVDLPPAKRRQLSAQGN
jgi:hypothetical protein